MKSIILCLVAFLVISSVRLYGQNCLSNGSFPDACTAVVDASKPARTTWTDACGDGWVRSHGTPQIKTYTSPGGGTAYCAYMWSSSNGGVVGEGMFTPTTFLPNHTYNVRIVFSTFSSVSGTVNVYAVNGLTQHPFDADAQSWDPVPSVGAANKKLIGSYTGGAVNNDDITFPSFTPDKEYDQIWIYPSETSTSQYNLYVFLVDVCSYCDGAITYNSGTVPSGFTVSGSIYAGSSAGSGGSGTVTTATDQQTTFQASHAVYLQPSFQAAPATNAAAFYAYISDCNIALTIPTTPDHFDSLSGITLDTTGEDAVSRQLLTGLGNSLNLPANSDANLTVFPTLGTGTLHIAGIPASFGNAEIMVSDGSGRTVFMLHNAGSTEILLDLGKLANGFYLLQIRNKYQCSIHKIIISK
ncbi:MAG: hypothetical protein Q8927_03230 [Bacteroidota bacterium]|nr:hypothetical protein [Bacteroidota bacterium]MDP4215187.1 hypothetical protein [Bacteroidota bacterium]MDP4244984.1 hypothetical protein [Bacteroidota bacterium]MDP4255458.1 hypothetical protein [Bacteroidota bacterium]MDP4256709.1 hypothetical protein [Bacteroidota bacterium]